MGFFDKVDMTKKSKAPFVINLAKSSDAHKIDLTQKAEEVVINLNWNSSIITEKLCVVW